MKRAGFILLVFLASMASSFAQCAMCKAVAETDANGGGTAALGLNTGILYLMAFPYLLIGTVGFFWYRHQKKLKQS
jgi:hypothetical protein